MRWCFLGSHEIPDGERMVKPAYPNGGSDICVPCSQTARGKRLMQDTSSTAGYRPNHHSRAGKWARIHAAMQQPDRIRKTHGG